MSNANHYQITGDSANEHTSLAIAAPKSNAPSQPSVFVGGTKYQVDIRGDGTMTASQGGALRRGNQRESAATIWMRMPAA